MSARTPALDSIARDLRRRARDAMFTVVLCGSGANGKREDFVVEASHSVEAIYKAKQKWAETHANAPIVIGIREPS